MDHNNVNPPPAAPPPYYAEQQAGGQANHHPPPANHAQPQYNMQQQGQQVQVMTVTRTSLAVMLEYILRGLPILTTLLAILLIATSEQTVRVSHRLEVIVKFSAYSALKYFLAANIIVLIYSIASLLLSIVIKLKSLILKVSNTIADIVAVSLLLSANGAASVISTQFDNIDHLFAGSDGCSTWDKFCSHLKASIAMSMLAVGLYLALIILSLLNSTKTK